MTAINTVIPDWTNVEKKHVPVCRVKQIKTCKDSDTFVSFDVNDELKPIKIIFGDNRSFEPYKAKTFLLLSKRTPNDTIHSSSKEVFLIQAPSWKNLFSSTFSNFCIGLENNIFVHMSVLESIDRLKKYLKAKMKSSWCKNDFGHLQSSEYSRHQN